MPDENQPAPINQTAVGNENIQVAGSHNVIKRITYYIQGETEQQRAQRNRQAMLELVKNTWVKGVLEKSLHHEMLIQIGMEERPGAVEHPWDMTVQMPDQPNRTVPPGTRIVDLFEESGCALLILGQPGSGKTTMLLELARDTIDRAEKDPTQPIPVVFNLSSWSDPKQSIENWLIAELRTKYYVPKKDAAAWVKNDEILPLLDGLDEVDVARRGACVQAINDFRTGHGLAPLIVCSRIADYEALNARLTLRGAVMLQPLTYEQVDNYLRKAGPAFSALRNAWRGYTTLQELAQTPLMLSIMMLAYQDTPAEELGGNQSESIESRRKRMFDVYVQRMFQRAGRTPKDLYPKEQTLHWLAWLARKLSQDNESTFLPERIKPSWLQTDRQREIYKTTFTLVKGWALGAMISFIIIIIPGCSRVMPIPSVFFGDAWWVGGLVTWLLFVAAVRLTHEDILPKIDQQVEVLKWSWQRARRVMVISLVVVLALILLLWLFTRNPFFELWWLLAGAVLGGLGAGLHTVTVEPNRIPNQVIRQAGITWGVAVPLASFAFGQLLWQFGPAGVLGSLLLGLAYTLNGVSTFGVRNAGDLVLNHYTLRLILAWDGDMPLNYIRFLDYAAERIFLRNVGGGYMFIHRLLQEHFAAMNTATPSANK